MIVDNKEFAAARAAIPVFPFDRRGAFTHFPLGEA
jgi:hypothetical protein